MLFCFIFLYNMLEDSKLEVLQYLYCHKFQKGLFMKTEKNKSYIPITTAAAGIGGALYGFRHPGEKSCLKISKLTPTIIDTMKEYKDSFDIVAAKNALNSGSIKQDEFFKIENIIKNFSDTLEKELTIKEILNTPFEKRTKSYQTAVREANASRPKLYKSLLKFTKDFQNKLAELKVFDKEKFTAAAEAAKKKTIAMYKELSKNALKGLGIGIAVGVAIGFFLDSIAKSRTNKNN